MGGCFATDGRLAPCGYRPSVDALLDLDAGAIGTLIRPDDRAPGLGAVDVPQLNRLAPDHRLYLAVVDDPGVAELPRHVEDHRLRQSLILDAHSAGMKRGPALWSTGRRWSAPCARRARRAVADTPHAWRRLSDDTPLTGAAHTRYAATDPPLLPQCRGANMHKPYSTMKVCAMRRSRHTLQRDLYEVAEGQGGYFTAAQAVAAGYRYPQQVYQRRLGTWEPIDRGLFRLRDFPPGEHEDLIRWSLWSRDRHGAIQATISHETAADLYGLGDVMPARVHLTVPPGFRKSAPEGCVLHIARSAAQTVRLPGARRVPVTSTSAWHQTRRENSGANGASRCSMARGRVGIVSSSGKSGGRADPTISPP